MNPLNQWIRLEQMDEENPRFDEFKNMLWIELRGEVEQFASWCSFKIFEKGAAVRFNRYLKTEQRQGFNILKFSRINIDALKFDDWFFTEINSIYLYELKSMVINDACCPHCFHEMTYNHKHRYLQCSKCDHVRPSWVPLFAFLPYPAVLLWTGRVF